MADWSTIASLSTEAGTLVLAVATFSATRSANRSARIAERAFQAGLRPVLVQSRPEDRSERFMWGDHHWSTVAGGRGWVEATPDAIYLAMSLRNVGAGMAVIHGWHASSTLDLSPLPHSEPEDFRAQSRDLYVPPGDSSFWQGAFRAADEEAREAFAASIARRVGIRRAALRRPRGRAAHDQPVLPPPARRGGGRSDELDRQRHPPPEPGPDRSALSVGSGSGTDQTFVQS